MEGAAGERTGGMAKRIVEEVARQGKSNKWCYNVNNLGLALHFILVIPSGRSYTKGSAQLQLQYNI